MNTSARISFAAVTAALAVIAFCFAACPHQENAATRQWTLSLKIHGKGTDRFLEVKQKDKFHQALCNLKNNGGDISDLEFQPDGAQTPYRSYDPCISPTPSSPATSGGDPNATQHVRTNSPVELKAVLDAFAEPSSTPTAGPSQ